MNLELDPSCQQLGKQQVFFPAVVHPAVMTFLFTISCGFAGISQEVLSKQKKINKEKTPHSQRKPIQGYKRERESLNVPSCYKLFDILHRILNFQTRLLVILVRLFIEILRSFLKQMLLFFFPFCLIWCTEKPGHILLSVFAFICNSTFFCPLEKEPQYTMVFKRHRKVSARQDLWVTEDLLLSSITRL